MKYEVLIFISEHQLSAIDVNEDGSLDRISLDGDEVLDYSGEKELEQFCGYVKEYYNISDFSEIEIAVKIICFHCDNYYANKMYEKMCRASECSIFNAAIILPLLLLKKTDIQKDSEYFVRAFGTQYSLVVDSMLNCKCTVDVREKECLELKDEEFALLSRFNYDHLASDEKKIQDLEKSYSLAMNLKQKEYQELLEKYNLGMREIEQLKKELKESRQEAQRYKGQWEEAGRRKTRVICRFKKNENGIAESILDWNWLLSAQSAEGGGRQYQFSHHQYVDGDFVKKNCIIAKVKLTYAVKNKKTPAKKYNDSNEIYYDVKAQTSGRIFYLMTAQ